MPKPTSSHAAIADRATVRPVLPVLIIAIDPSLARRVTRSCRPLLLSRAPIGTGTAGLNGSRDRPAYRSQVVADPDVRLPVDPEVGVPVDPQRFQAAGDDVFAAVGQGQAEPVRPLGDGTGDRHRLRGGGQDPGTVPEMTAQPGIEHGPVVGTPAQ